MDYEIDFNVPLNVSLSSLREGDYFIRRSMGLKAYRVASNEESAEMIRVTSVQAGLERYLPKDTEVIQVYPQNKIVFGILKRKKDD